MSGVSKFPNKDKAGERGIRVQKVEGAEGWGCASKAGVRAGEVSAEATFEGRHLRLRRPVLPELSGHMWAEGAGEGPEGPGGSQRGLYFDE